jgi:hypothetical protein
MMIKLNGRTEQTHEFDKATAIFFSKKARRLQVGAEYRSLTPSNYKWGDVWKATSRRGGSRKSVASTRIVQRGESSQALLLAMHRKPTRRRQRVRQASILPKVRKSNTRRRRKRKRKQLSRRRREHLVPDSVRRKGSTSFQHKIGRQNCKRYMSRM